MEKLRKDLKIIRSVLSGEVAYIVKDPIGLKYYRFSELEGTVFKYLDDIRHFAAQHRANDLQIFAKLFHQ